MIVFGSPGRYYQGVGCLDRLAEAISAIGSRAAVISDAYVLSQFGERLVAALTRDGLQSAIVPFSGDVTYAAIQSLIDQIAGGELKGSVDVVVAFGGGKAIDVTKAVAHRVGCPIITVPTSAANDAPTSKNYVVYDENKVLVEVAHLPANPAAVLVDTAIIASAPKALLAAGVGDAITKAFEVAQSYAVGGPNFFGAEPPLTALVLANACYDSLRRYAAEALEVSGSGQPTPAFEKIVEALLLMGGLSFESGGLSMSHAMTRGISRVPGAAAAMHGQQVAYALLVQLTLEGRSEPFLEDMRRFYGLCGLATSLSALGTANADEADYRAIAVPSLAAPLARNFSRKVTEDELVAAMQAVERAASVPA